MRISVAIALVTAAGCLVGPSARADELLWSDEFDGTTLDASKWEAMIGDGSAYGIPGWGNNEIQYYQSDPDNLFVSGGHLHIVAREQSAGGYPYTSARIRTLNKAEFLYGRLEARIQLPSTTGIWPAFWMLPTNSPYGGWASGGEMDILESVNLADRTYGTLHFGDTWPNNSANGGTLDHGNPISGFHVYAMEWDPFQIRWYFDGQLYHTANSHQWWSVNAPGDNEAPFDVPFHFLLNVAVGGTFPGYPDESSVFPAEMLVDYVRVYVDELQAPFGGSAKVLPGLIQAEDFDLGGAGVGYWDADMTNFGGAYRPDQGVDLELALDGSHNVGWIREREWLAYTVDFQDAGEYTVFVDVASESTGGRFHLELDGAIVSPSVIVPATGDFQSWTMVETTIDVGTAGEHELRFVNDSTNDDAYNLNWMVFDFIEPLAGDVNGDGVVGFVDLTIILAYWGQADPIRDIDGSGIVDFGDLMLVLGNWGS